MVDKKYTHQMWVIAYTEVRLIREGRKWYIGTSEGIRWPVSKLFAENQLKLIEEKRLQRKQDWQQGKEQAK